MKRTKFIMLALVVALVLMGAGYAAWTQVFTINSTVETGELFVQVASLDSQVFVDDGTNDLVPNYTTAGIEYLDVSTIEIEGDTLTNRNGDESLKKITYNPKQVFPGTKIVSTLSFKNLGTIPAITGVGTNKSISHTDLFNALEFTVIDKNGIGHSIAGSGTTKLDNLAAKIAEVVGTLPLGAEPTVIAIVQVFPLDKSTSDSSDNLENIDDPTWSLELEFTQYNNTTN